MSSSGVGPRARSRSRGRLIVISGPSGAGKTSICRALLRDVPDTVWSVSVTTRTPRDSDQPGTSYDFVSREEFERREREGAFLECAEYVGNRYGTPRAPVERSLGLGRNVLLEVDVQGGMQIAKSMPESVRIFVMPPSSESLRTRLEGRDRDARDQLTKRLAESDGEIRAAHESGAYQHFVVNDLLDDTIAHVKRILEKESETE